MDLAQEVDDTVVRAQRSEIEGVHNGGIELNSNMRKGNYGEMGTDELYRSKGYDRISKDPVTGIDGPTHHGIDGVYYNPDGEPPYIISESKYNTARLGMTKDGKQMSAPWIDDRLNEAVGKKMADRIRLENKLGNVDKQLVNIKPDGTVKITRLAEDGSKLK